MIEMILTFYVQLKVLIGCYEELNFKISHVVIVAN